MRIEDGFTFIAGVGVGALLMQLLVINVFKNIKMDIRAKHAALVKIDGELRACCVTTHDYVQTIWAYIAYKLINGSPMSVRNKRLSWTMYIGFWLLFFVFLFFGVAFIIDVNHVGE